MNLEGILSNYTYLFILIMVRYIGLFILAPIFGSRIFPIKVKIGLVFFLTVLTLPLLENSGLLGIPSSPFLILIEVLHELIIGFTIGFISYLAFAAIELAGQFSDLAMGFTMVSVLDPMQGTNVPVMGQFKNILAVLVFLAMNGHHFLIKALYRSFELVPLGGASLTSAGLKYIFRLTANLFIIAFKIALPVIGTLFIVDVIFGFFARAIPQMNVFIIGLPLKILIGFIILFLSLHFTIYFFHDIFLEMYQEILGIFKFFS